MTPDPKDAALRKQVRKAIDGKVWFDLGKLTDAVLAAITEPTPVVRSHACANGVTITYTEGQPLPWGRPSGAAYESLAKALPFNASTTDDDIAACLALKGQGEPCAPSWWVNVALDGSVMFAHPSEERARNSVDGHASAFKRIAVPLYEAPPAATPRAPQKVECYANIFRATGHIYCHKREKDAIANAGSDDECEVAVPLVRAATPLVRGDVTEGGR